MYRVDLVCLGLHFLDGLQPPKYFPLHCHLLDDRDFGL